MDNALAVDADTLVVRTDEPGIVAWLKQRQALGADHSDEIWEGVYHVTPHANMRHNRLAMAVMHALAPRSDALGMWQTGEFNLGQSGAYRIPDGGWFSGPYSDELYAQTAEVVLEVLSPDDETYAKFPFFAAHHVREVLVVDPEKHAIDCWTLGRDGKFRQVDASAVFGVTMAVLHDDINWS